MLKLKYNTLQEIKAWLFSMNINNYNINDDLTVDVQENVYLTNKNLNEIPIQFGIVDGGFYCDKNNLISLYGSPKTVTGEFNCSDNNLSTLEFSPDTVGTYFLAGNNKIKNIKGISKVILKNLYLVEQNLDYINFSDLPEYVKFKINIYNCNKIENLKELYNDENEIISNLFELRNFLLSQKLLQNSEVIKRKKI